MAEILNYDTADGIGSWCYDNKPDSCTKYGRLYNWGMTMAGSSSSDANPSGVRGVCPSGWHLPSRPEWIELAKTAGGTGDYGSGGSAGKALRSTSGWYINGTDDFGFSALPGGDRISNGYFNNVGYYGYWWVATERYDGVAYRWGIPYNDYYSNSTSNGDYSKGNGLSVRCVGDN